ncbi:MAG: hypothetical protein WCO84_01585 [bacterium]
MEEEKRPKRATKKQMEEIDGALQSVGFEMGWADFVKGITTESGRKSFAKSMKSTLQGIDDLSAKSAYDGIYQPLLSQDLLQEININPRTTTSEEIEKMLASPQYYADALRGINLYLSYAVGAYRRTIWYFNTIKSFNYDLRPVDFAEDKDIDDVEYMKSYTKALDVLKKLNIKYQIPKIDLQVMYDGFACYYINETSDSISFVLLPSKFCYITAPNSYSFSCAFDLTYFDRFANPAMREAVPNLYAAYEDFCQMREERMAGKKKIDGDLIPMQYYPLPLSKSWTFTFSPIHPDKVPPMSSAMSSGLDIIGYKSLMKNQFALNLFKLIAFKIPLSKDTNKPIITYEQASLIISAIKTTMPTNVIPFASPFESEAISVDQTSKFEDVIDISNNSFYSSAGVPQALFGSKEAKQGSALAIAANVDFAYASTHMYSQFENMVNFILFSNTGKYKFKVKFFGNKLTEAKDASEYGTLMRTCNLPATRLFAMLGYEPFEIVPTLKLEERLGIKELLTPIKSAFNSKDEGESGAKRKNELALTDGGTNSRDYE